MSEGFSSPSLPAKLPSLISCCVRGWGSLLSLSLPCPAHPQSLVLSPAVLLSALQQLLRTPL